MNVNPFSYLIEKLNSKFDKTGGTIQGSDDAPLTIKSGNNTGAYVGFKASNNTFFGYIGVKSDKKPYFYDTEARRIALTSDIPKSLQTTKTTDSYGQFTLDIARNKIYAITIIGGGNTFATLDIYGSTTIVRVWNVVGPQVNALTSTTVTVNLLYFD